MVLGHPCMNCSTPKGVVTYRLRTTTLDKELVGQSSNDKADYLDQQVSVVLFQAVEQEMLLIAQQAQIVEVQQ